MADRSLSERLSQIELAYAADRFRLRQVLQRVLGLPEDLPRRAIDLERWESSLAQSIERRRARKAIQLEWDYDSDLPIVAHREELIRLIRDRQVLVVCGETGSGKSTQLPKLCLEAGFGRERMIGHTQPRRIAARSIAARLKEEIGQSRSEGSIVGFKIRFTDATAPTTLVKLMTDGVLLAELARDRFLDAYEVLIVDEAHERSLNIDLTLAYLHRLLPKRPDLRLIITSATIDAERFAGHFHDALGPAPIVSVSGRTFDVDIRYSGVNSEDRTTGVPTKRKGEDSRELVDDASADGRLLRAVDELLDEIRGDILCFFASEREIRDAHRLLKGHLTAEGNRRRVEILPLYSRLTEAEQQRVFAPHRDRRIVLATNVAESSLTVPGIYSVIDTGTARISRYAPRSKVQRLPIEPISQASANQRAGRCGRLAPGICIRLYDESDFLSRPPYTTPEIRRTDLAAAILQTELLGIGPLEALPLLDPPRAEMIQDGIATLQEIGALQPDGKLTDIGRKLGRWPVSPRVGRMLIEAERNGCLADVLIIAAGLEAEDPRIRPADRQAEADKAHARFSDSQSDFVSYLKLWDLYHRLKADLGRSRLEKACRELYLSVPRLREWSDLHRQLLQLTQDSGFRTGTRRISFEAWKESEAADQQKAPASATKPASFDFTGEYADIHQSLLAGLLSGIAHLDDTRKYKGVGGIEYQLWPGSGLRSHRPRWIVAAEIVETHQRYARVAAAIDPDWIEPLASNLLKRHYEAPHFSRKQGRAMIYERATLYGLPVVARRPVPLAPIDSSQARRILIDQGLVEQQLVSRAVFYQHNIRLLEDVQAWAAKTRRRDLIVDPFFLQQFYQERLPESVVDRASLEKIDGESSALKLTWEELVASFDRQAAQHAFPESLAVGPTRLQLDYRFAPGAEDDGITVRVPESVAGDLSDDRLGWLVPGLLEEKVASLIKTLPKNLRRNLVPAPQMAVKAAEQLAPFRHRQSPFWTSLCSVLTQLGGERIQRSDFDLDRLDPHLKMRLEIVDSQGKVIETTRDAGRRSAAETSAVRRPRSLEADQRPPWYRDQMTRFEVESIPRSIVVDQHDLRLECYVGLVDHHTFVRPELFDDPRQAEIVTAMGLIRLYVLAEHRELRSQIQYLPQYRDCQLWLADRVPGDRLRDQLEELLAKLAFLPDEIGASSSNQPWTRLEFERPRQDRVRKISMAAAEVGKWLPRFAQSYHHLRLNLQSPPPTWKNAFADIHRQLDNFFQPFFLIDTPWQWLKEFPRYLQAIQHRIQRLKSTGVAIDTQQMEKIHVYWNDYQKRVNESKHLVYRRSTDPLKASCWPIGRLAEYRWMIEEYRVSLFAQQLGTRSSVSPKRLDKLRDECDMS